MKNKKTILTVIIVALLGGGYFYLNSAKAEKANLTEDDIKTIITESPKYGDLTVDVSATGILYSSKDVTVGAQASGQINKIEYKFYRAKENLEIDAALNSLSINFKNKETWWDVVDLFLKSGNKYLALKAQRYATPIFSDIITLFFSPEMIRANEIMSKEMGDNAVQIVTNKIREFIKDMPHFNRPTTLEVGEEKIVAFDLEKVYLMTNSHKEMGYNNYWFSLILKLIYENSTEGQREGKTNNKMIINELHRFSGEDSLNLQIDKLVKDSKENNLELSLITQNVERGAKYFKEATAIFTSEIQERDKDLFLDLGFKDYELKIMKNFKHPFWAVKTKEGNNGDFDIVEMEMTPHLLFATSSHKEDMLIKSQLLKSNNYFNALNKAITYMAKNNLKSFSTYFGNIAYDEKIPQESIDRLVNDINKIDRND